MDGVGEPRPRSDRAALGPVDGRAGASPGVSGRDPDAREAAAGPSPSPGPSPSGPSLHADVGADRQARIERLVAAARSRRHRGPLEGAEVSLPGGNPGCGDVVTMYLRADDDGRITGLSYDGHGCTLSQAGAALLVDLVLRESRRVDDVEAMTADEVYDLLGRDLALARPRCSTLALGTLKAAVRRWRDARRRDGARER
jgi:nitrogen fixation NifU-like protein